MRGRDLELGLTANKSLSFALLIPVFIFSFRFCQQAVNASVKNKARPAVWRGRLLFVGVARFELATLWSQTRYATNCAIPRFGLLIRQPAAKAVKECAKIERFS